MSEISPERIDRGFAQFVQMVGDERDGEGLSEREESEREESGREGE